jgi:hypothetical protein
MQKQGKRAELQLPEFDAVPCTKVSEIHALRVEAILSSLPVGAFSGAALSSVSNLCDRIVWL